MSLAPRLDLRQSQQLVMTPQLQQAIKLLALSNVEVEAFIADVLERNPLLDTGGAGDGGAGDGGAGDGGAGDGGGGSDAAAPHDAPPAAGAEPTGLDALLGGGTASADTPLDVNLDSEDYHQDSAADRALGVGGIDGSLGLAGAGGGTEDGPDLDRFAAVGPSLHDHLRVQAGELLSGPDLLIADALVDLVEETGYLTGPLGELALRLGVPLARVERILAVIQTLDPPGVAARNLAECLALQARDANRYDPAMARLLANLDYLAKGNLAALKRICQVDEEDLADMIREVRAYDPKPGCRFDAGGERIEAVQPDIFVARRGTGWVVELNGATLPRLLVDRRYHAELAGGAQDKSSKVWLAECLADANWLVKALDQRARTIVKVASEIVKQQEGFFLRGVAGLRPLTLRAVADAIEMHESTVSRVTSNKYLSCERGLFELKYFFGSGIQSADGGEAASALAVKSRIKALIAAEDAKAILSDDTLVEMLNGEGFDIARRTVAKYREAIGLGSSVQRRRHKAIGRAA